MKIKNEITIIKPDDWHVHLRDNQFLKTVVNYTSNVYKRALIMPNLNNPITNLNDAINYRNKILKYSKNKNFSPLMSIYLTHNTNIRELEVGYFKKIFIGAKLYPLNSTTNSHFGINNIDSIFTVLDTMQKIGMPLLIHGEIIDVNIDIFDREKKFIDYILQPLQKRYPELKIVLEHVTTKYAIDYIKNHNPKYLSGTITPHHLLLTRNNLFEFGINPHYYCLPIVKKKTDQEALKNAISKNNKHFFLGSDSAPHDIKDKEKHHGHAGIFNAPSSLIAYLQIFEDMQSIENFETFASINGPNFYNLPINTEKLTFIKKKNKIPEIINVNKYKIIPFLSGKTLDWSIKSII